MTQGVLHDLGIVKSVYDVGDVSLIRLGPKLTAHCISKNLKLGRITLAATREFTDTIVAIEQRVSNLPVPVNFEWSPNLHSQMQAITEALETHKQAVIAHVDSPDIASTHQI